MQDNCPRCAASMIGDPVLDHHQTWTDLDGNPLLHWRREIGVEVWKLHDGVLFYVCPECCWAWPRYDSPNDEMYAMSAIQASRYNSLGRPVRTRERWEGDYQEALPDLTWSTWDALLTSDDWATVIPVNKPSAEDLSVQALDHEHC